MPELPEVETVKNGLAPKMEGQILRDVILRRKDLRYPFPEGFAQKIKGQRVRKITRRAKFLIFDFGGFGFLGHLGMSGSYRIAPLNETYRKHDHFTLIFDEFQVIYHDPRRFGAVDLWQGDAPSHKWLSKLGPEPLGNHFSGMALSQALSKRQTPIKSALLDQNIVAGLGNIYVCEALFEAGVSPLRPANQLKMTEANRLAQIIRTVLDRAIASGGSSLRDYVNAEGELGYFQHEFHVYAQEGQMCKNGCGGEIARITQSGRSSFYCPSCQS